MKAPLRYLDKAQCLWVEQWWQALQGRRRDQDPPQGVLLGLGNADGANLRRCANLDELLLSKATHRLAQGLLALEVAKVQPRFKESDYAGFALMAGALAQVRDHMADGASLPARLGLGSVKSGSRPPLSEIRFRRLQKASDVDDFYRLLSRVLKLANGKTDIAVLANDLLGWELERRSAVSISSHDLKFRWANDYYLSASA